MTAAGVAVEFANGLSESVGESISRATMHACGLAPPELQVPFYDSGGLIGIADFYWREANIIGEFDGLGKYLREEFSQGREPADIVIAEQSRDDRLRACGPRVVRWQWETATSPQKLARQLREAGVPRAR